MTQEEIKDISKLSAKFDAYQGIRGGYKTDNFDSNTATLLYFCYKTDKNIIYKIKENNNGGKRAIRKDENFNPPKTEAARFEKRSKELTYGMGSYCFRYKYSIKMGFDEKYGSSKVRNTKSFGAICFKCT